jgi:TP901 family phage tail tape measure protein
MTFEKFSEFVKKAQGLVSGKNFDFVDGLPDLDQGIVKTGEKSVLQGVSKEVFNSDSFQTQLLKMLGFEGIDLRGTKHNGTYTGGTVIFDVKPESIKTTNEKWSDVMASHGYEIDEDDLRLEEKRRQLAFDTAKAYSQQAESAENAKKSLQDVLDLASRMSTESGDTDAFNARHNDLLDRARDLTSNVDYDQMYEQLIADENKYQQEVEETNRLEIERQKQFDEFAASSTSILSDESVPFSDRERLFTEFVDQILQGEMSASDAIDRLSNAMGELRKQSASMPDDIMNDFGAENEKVAEAVSQLQKLSSVDVTRIFDSVDLKSFLEAFNIDTSNFATFRALFEELMQITKAMSDGVDVGNAFDVKMEEITGTIMRLGGHMADLDDSGYATMMQEFYRHIGGTKVQFNGSIKAEYTKDQWKALYNTYKGRLTSDVTKGISADSLYEELTYKWPSLFPADLDDKDRFKLIFEKLDEARQLQANNWKVLQGFVSSDRAGIQGSVDDIYNKMNNALYADASADSLGLEADAFNDVEQSAEKAAKAKEKFDKANQKVKKGADASANSLDDEADGMARVVAATPPDSEGWDAVTQYKAGDNDEPNAIRRTRTVRADDSNRQITETLTLNENGEWETAGSTQTDNYRVVRQEELNALYKEREHCLTNILKYTKEIDNADTEAGRNAARDVLALEQERLDTINASIEAYGDLVSQQKLDAQDNKLVVKTRDHEQQRYIDMTEDERTEAANAALQRRQAILNNIAKLEKQRNGAVSEQEREAINAIIATEQERARIVAREIDLYESVNAAQKVQQQDAKVIEKSRQQQQQQTIADTKRAAKEQKRLNEEQTKSIEKKYDEYLSAQKNIQKFDLDLSSKDHTDSRANEYQKMVRAEKDLLDLGVDVKKISDSDVLTLEQKEKLLEKEAKHRREIHDLIVSASDKERDMQKKDESKAASPYKTSYNNELEAFKKIEASVRSFGDDGVSSELQSQIAGYKKLVDELGALNKQLDENHSLAKDEKFSKHYEDVAMQASKARVEIEGVFKGSQKLQKLGTLVKVGDKDVTKLGNLKVAMMEFANTTWDGEAKIAGFNKEETEMYVTLDRGAGAVENITVALDKASGRLNAFSSGTSKATNEWNQFKTQAADGIKRAASMYLGFNDLIRYGRQGVQSVKEIDLAMTELKKVTDETDASYKEFLKDASGTSAIIGSTISDFTEATATFARLGYSMEESSSMAETAIIYKNVADGLDSVEESSDSIISTMMAFGIEANDTMSIIDRFNAVGNNFAITSAGIGEALQRSASALFSAGNTIDESIALVTSANSVIQNPEQVGTALKTLALRLRGAKTELEEAGEDVEGMAENTSQLQAKLKALTHGKVDIMLDADTFKSTTQILREMSAAWEDMTDIERASALELMGGKRQAKQKNCPNVQKCA